MNKNLVKAKELIESTDAVFAAVSDLDTITSPVKGIGFVASLCNEKRDLSSFCVADKIVGKAAAMLFVLLGIKTVHAKILSLGGKEVFQRYGIQFTYDVLTEVIINRTCDGMCPMENAVRGCTEPFEALESINKTIEMLKKANNGNGTGQAPEQ